MASNNQLPADEAINTSDFNVDSTGDCQRWSLLVLTYICVYVYLGTLPAMSTLGRSRGYKVTRAGKLVSSEIVPFSWKFKVSSALSSAISSAVVCRLERVFRKLSRGIWPKSTDTLVAVSRRERGSASSSTVDSDSSQCEFVILFISYIGQYLAEPVMCAVL